MSGPVDEIAMALVVAEWLVEHYRWRAANDPEHALVWEEAAEVAQEWVDLVDRVVEDELGGWV